MLLFIGLAALSYWCVLLEKEPSQEPPLPIVEFASEMVGDMPGYGSDWKVMSVPPLDQIVTRE